MKSCLRSRMFGPSNHNLPLAHSLFSFRVLSRVYFRGSALRAQRFTYLMNILRGRAAEMFHSSQLSLATTTDRGIFRFLSNQMSGNGNVSRRSFPVHAEEYFSRSIVGKPFAIKAL